MKMKQPHLIDRIKVLDLKWKTPALNSMPMQYAMLTRRELSQILIRDLDGKPRVFCPCHAADPSYTHHYLHLLNAFPRQSPLPLYHSPCKRHPSLSLYFICSSHAHAAYFEYWLSISKAKADHYTLPLHIFAVVAILEFILPSPCIRPLPLSSLHHLYNLTKQSPSYLPTTIFKIQVYLRPLTEKTSALRLWYTLLIHKYLLPTFSKPKYILSYTFPNTSKFPKLGAKGLSDPLSKKSFGP